jgi:RNA polymerase sigma-70 factor, ECF subfamily
VPLDVAGDATEKRAVRLIALDEVLDELAARDTRKGRIVELKFFGGLTTKEIAEVLQVSSSTVENDWRMARAWLYREMSNGRSNQ